MCALAREYRSTPTLLRLLLLLLLLLLHSLQRRG